MKRLLSVLEFYLPVTMLVFMVIIVALQVIMRYILSSPLSWPEEVTRWCLIWITFVGISYGMQHEALVRVDFFVKKIFPNHFKTIISIVNVIVVLFFLYMSISGIFYTMAGLTGNKKMPVTNFPTAVANIAIGLGGLLGALRGLSEFYHNVKSQKEEAL